MIVCCGKKVGGAETAFRARDAGQSVAQLGALRNLTLMQVPARSVDRHVQLSSPTHYRVLPQYIGYGPAILYLRLYWQLGEREEDTTDVSVANAYSP